MRPRSALYRLEGFGLVGNPWLAWSLARGALDELCMRCLGKGVEIRSPCKNREVIGGSCDRERGCSECRSTCLGCSGRRLTAPPDVLGEDFGDEESRDAALRMFPGLTVEDGRRIDMEAPALGGPHA